MKTPRQRARSAFSLVEVVVVSGIAVSLFGLIMGLQFRATQTRVFTQERDIAREAASARLEQIAASPFGTIEATYHNVDFAVNGLVSSAAPQGAGTVIVDTATAPASAGDAGLKRITVRIRWLSKANGGLAETFDLTTLLANRELQ